jgi:hypothetical protein
MGMGIFPLSLTNSFWMSYGIVEITGKTRNLPMPDGAIAGRRGAKHET